MIPFTLTKDLSIFSGYEATFLQLKGTTGWFTSTILFAPLLQGQSWSESAAGIKGEEHPRQLLWTTGKKFQPGLVLWDYLPPKISYLNVVYSLGGNRFTYSSTIRAPVGFRSHTAGDLNSSQKGSGTITTAPPSQSHTHKRWWAERKTHIVISVWSARRLLPEAEFLFRQKDLRTFFFFF